MFKWVQSGLSAVAGTAEPEYGREAIHPVTDFIKGGVPVSRATTTADFCWRHPDHTNVETQTFYFTDLASGYTGFAQIIHSNLMNIKTTAQFTFRLYNTRGEDKNEIWTSTALEDFRTDGANFYAKNLAVEGQGDNVYTIKSTVNAESEVDLVVTRVVPGVVFGADGLTLYGDNKDEPWGDMRHVFWPRCSVAGTVTVRGVPVPVDGLSMFVMALQGMKPHHAAKAWNFMNFQSENFSAVQMEFTTPKSYATTKVNVAILTSKDEILATSIDNEITHEGAEVDEVGWPVPKAITFSFTDGTASEEVASVKGSLSNLVERIDVMAEIPQFIKTIVSGVAGARPYIYQYCNDFTITHKDTTEKGVGFTEVTFISD